MKHVTVYNNGTEVHDYHVTIKVGRKSLHYFFDEFGAYLGDKSENEFLNVDGKQVSALQKEDPDFADQLGPAKILGASFAEFLATRRLGHELLEKKLAEQQAKKQAELEEELRRHLALKQEAELDVRLDELVRGGYLPAGERLVAVQDEWDDLIRTNVLKSDDSKVAYNLWLGRRTEKEEEFKAGPLSGIEALDPQDPGFTAKYESILADIERYVQWTNEEIGRVSRRLATHKRHPNGLPVYNGPMVQHI